MTVPRRSWRPADWQIATRLLVLVLVPLVGLLLFAATTISVRTSAVNQAAEVRQDVERVSKLVKVRAALFEEWVPSESYVALARLGLGPDQANRIFDGDLAQELQTGRARVNEAVAVLADNTIVGANDLAVLRAAVDAAPHTPSGELGQFFDPLAARIDQAVSLGVAHARLRMPQMDGVQPVSDALRATQNAIALSEATLNSLNAVEASFLRTTDDGTASRQFAAQRTKAQLAVNELDASTIPAVADAWAAVKADEGYARLQTEMQRFRQGDGPHLGASDGLDRMGQLGRDGMAHEQALFHLIDTTNRAAGDAAREVEDAAHDELVKSILLPLPLVLAAVAVSLAVARSISRPLRRLATHAAMVGAGDLAVAPLGGRGPRDIAVASRAIDDLVANLRLLDAKSQALADLDFDAPVLSERLPGQLGRALERSITVVSGSIGERDELQNRLLQQATQDPLTGVLNRAAAAEDLDQALARARRTGAGLAVLHLDLDDFQRVNDAHGHATGDRVLQETARVLRAAAGDDALIARIGGDEFIVAVEGVTDPGDIDDLAHGLGEALRRPGGTTVTVGVCIGIAFTWDGSDAATQLLARAEMAVHRAKTRGAGTVELYDEGLQQQLRELAEIEDALTNAISTDELFLQYQPVIDLATGRMSSVEALVRWQRPDIGVQPPDTFIPVAERSDLIVDLDRWVMRRAAAQLTEWAQLPEFADIHVAVNVSGRHLLGQNLYDHVVDLLDTTGIAPQRLVVEITETVLVNDLVVAAAQLEAVRGLGVRIALDDFGTGYTSITHLRQLPIDIIKIDRSFVQLLGRERDRKLLAMITELGHDLGVTITAEGVETEEQYELLRELGCDRAQGYLMSRPLPAGDLQTWARDQDRAPAA